MRLLSVVATRKGTWNINSIGDPVLRVLIPSFILSEAILEIFNVTRRVSIRMHTATREWKTARGALALRSRLFFHGEEEHCTAVHACDSIHKARSQSI